MNKRIIGIAIGGTKSAVSFAVYNGEFSYMQKVTFRTNPNSPDEVMENIYQAITDLGQCFDMISVISGGPLDIKEGTILKPPHLPGFDGFNIVKTLQNRYKCPVFLLNDADACALAEFKFGAGKGSRNMAFLTFGTGLGAGLVLNGELYTGNNGMAGEIGHVKLSEDGPIGYGKPGTAEGYCSGGNIPVWAKEYIKGKVTHLNNLETFDAKDIADAARKGDVVSKEILEIVATRLGQTISILIDTLNLDTVVIGGIYPRIEDLIKDKLLEVIEKESINENYKACKVVPSLLKEEIDEYSSLVAGTIGDNMKTFFERYPELLEQKDNIDKAIDVLEKCYKTGGKILVCGNGGSAADSAHIVGELMKGFMSKRPLKKEVSEKIEKEFNGVGVVDKLQVGIPCIDLTAQSALNSAYANDVDYDFVYAQQVIGYSMNFENDVLIAISTSGFSKNVVNAVKVANAIGLETIALTGNSKNDLSELCSVCIKAPANEVYRIQEYHLPIYHYICMELEKRIG